MRTPLVTKVDSEVTVAEREPLMNMNTRREFLSLTLKGATMAAATGFLAEAAAAPDTADMAGGTGTAQTLGINGKCPYKPPFTFGMGGFPFGTEFEVVPAARFPKLDSGGLVS